MLTFDGSGKLSYLGDEKADDLTPGVLSKTRLDAINDLATRGGLFSRTTTI